MLAIFTGQPADEAARPLERALISMGPTENCNILDLERDDIAATQIAVDS
jgi:predicted secreted Zn-dependent protease